MSNGISHLGLQATAEFLVRTGNRIIGLIVDQEIRRDISPVLRAIYETNSIPGHVRVYALRNVKGPTFQLFLHWFCYGNLTVPTLSKEWLETAEGGLTNEATQSLCQDRKSLIDLWIIADGLKIPRLQNLALDRLSETRFGTPEMLVENFHYIYKATSHMSPLRSFIMYQSIDEIREQFFVRYAEAFPRQLLVDMVVALFSEELLFGACNRSDRMPPRIVYDFHVPEG